jgi:hypothetical protein
VTDSSERFCTSCGEPVGAEAKFCISCGAALVFSTPVSPPAPATDSADHVRTGETAHTPDGAGTKTGTLDADGISDEVTPPPLASVETEDGVQPVAPSEEPAAPSPLVKKPNDAAHPFYTVCTIREVVEGIGADPEQSLIFPVPSTEPDSVVLELRDGTISSRALCSLIEVDLLDSSLKRQKTLLKAPDISAQVQLTEARLTLACTKYQKGGGWYGDPLSMIVLNAGSKIRASVQRRGKMLVGQVRYPWVRAVYAQNKDGWRRAPVLRVIMNVPGDQAMRLDLTFPKHFQATSIATDLIRLAARYRLTHEFDLGDDERSKLEELAEIPPLVYQPGTGNMVGRRFPTYWNATPATARIGLAVSEAPSAG